MAPVSERTRDRFLRLYATDVVFHAEVNRLLAGEVADLRAVVARIGAMRREDFGGSGFRYELAVRRTADEALRRLVS